MHLSDIVKHFPHQTLRDENDVVLNVIVTNDITKQDFYNDILHDFMTGKKELASYVARGRSFSSFTVHSGRMAGVTFIKHPCSKIEAYRALTINALLPNNSRNVLAFVVGEDGSGYLVMAWSRQIRFIADKPETARYASRISTYVGLHLWPENFVVDGLSSQMIDVGFQMSNPPRLFVDNFGTYPGKAFPMDKSLVVPMNHFRNMPLNVYQMQNMIKFDKQRFRIIDDALVEKIVDEVLSSLPKRSSSDHETVHFNMIASTLRKLPNTKKSLEMVSKVDAALKRYPQIEDSHHVYEGGFSDLIRQSAIC